MPLMFVKAFPILLQPEAITKFKGWSRFIDSDIRRVFIFSSRYSFLREKWNVLLFNQDKVGAVQISETLGFGDEVKAVLGMFNYFHILMWLCGVTTEVRGRPPDPWVSAWMSEFLPLENAPCGKTIWFWRQSTWIKDRGMNFIPAACWLCLLGLLGLVSSPGKQSDDDTRTWNCLMCVWECVLKHFGSDGKAIQLFVSRLLECYPWY